MRPVDIGPEDFYTYSLAVRPSFEYLEFLLPAHAALGQALLQTGRAQDAIPHLKAALPIDEDGSARFQLFRAYAIAGRSESAKQALLDYKEFTKRLRLANP